jgi:hypothetical protein
MIKVSQVGGRQRNVTFHVRGMLVDGDLPLTPIELGDKTLKLTSLLWAVQEKLCLHLWWNSDDEILPIESRNSMRFDQALNAPAGWNGIVYLSSTNWTSPRKAFFLIMDFDK